MVKKEKLVVYLQLKFKGQGGWEKDCRMIDEVVHLEKSRKAFVANLRWS